MIRGAQESGWGQHLDDSGWISSHNRIRRNVPGHNAPGTNYRLFANDNATEQRGTRPYRGTAFNQSRDTLPIRFSLQFTIVIGRARVAVVNERDIVADEDAFLQGHTFANKRVTGDLAIVADASPFLDFHESTDLDVVADFASVKIRETIDADSLAELHIRSDLLERLTGDRHKSVDYLEGQENAVTSASALCRWIGSNQGEEKEIFNRRMMEAAGDLQTRLLRPAI